MRLEIIPLALGVIVGIVGLALLFDAWFVERRFPIERRRRPRHERDRVGEALLGFGVLAIAAALLGRDTWRYSILTVIVGTVLLIWGAKRSGAYINGVIGRAEPPAPRAPSLHSR